MYNNLLVAVDLAEDPTHRVLEKAKSLMNGDTRLRVLHVVEPQYTQYGFDPTFTGSMIRSLEAEAMVSAQRRVAELCEPYDIDEDDQHILMGHTSTETEIHEFAKAKHCDLIVMGSHGRRGWQRLLGSTANAVLHGTPVDVCMCYIPPEGSS